MHRKFIATVAAASILITGFAAVPAQANQQDVGRALAAVLGLAIVGAVIHDSQKDKKKVQHVQPAPRHKTIKRAHNPRHYKSKRFQRRVHTHRQRQY